MADDPGDQGSAVADEPVDRVAAYLAGDLATEAAGAFEAHLLECDSCWAAVRADRVGRAAVERLREVAPAGLADRIRAVIELSEGGAGPASRRTRRRSRLGGVAVAGLVLVVAVAMFAGAKVEFRHRKVDRDPQVVRQLVYLASQPGPDGPIVAAAGDSGGFAMSRRTAAGVSVIVARSPAAFAMPDRAVPMTSTGDPWVARRGGVTLVCLNTPHPILVAAALPAERLEILALEFEQTN